MSLETATYIDGLQPANPAAGDLASAGDDHLRLIKQTIQNTFPNINDAVTPTAAELNKLAGLTTTGAELEKLHGVTVGATDINRLVGLTGNIQPQINAGNAQFSDFFDGDFTDLSDQVTANTAAIVTNTNDITDLQDALDALGGGLGFTPVQQGGGDSMSTNSVKIGRDSATNKLRAQIDSTGIGLIVTSDDGTIGGAYAGLAYGDVGSLGFMFCTVYAVPGDVKTGALLRWAGMDDTPGSVGHVSYSVAPSGNWMCLGFSNNDGCATLWKRVS